jgi:hypothetical protein
VLVQMLASAAEPLNQQELPAIEVRPGLPLPLKKTLLVPNVQYGNDDGDDDDEAMHTDALPPP